MIALFILIYGAFGMQSPFFPMFLMDRGFEAATIGLFLAGGTAIKLISAPLMGHLADRLAARSGVLAGALAGYSLTAVGLVVTPTAGVLCGIIAVQAFCLGPVPTIADALALNSRLRLSYGSVRGSGAAAFILCLTASGRVVEQLGLAATFIASAGLSAMGATLLCLQSLPAQAVTAARSRTAPLIGVKLLLRLRAFRLVLAISGLVLGSHALHDGFTVLRWTNAGMSPSIIGYLWSLAVASEVLVFFLFGEPLMRRLGPANACLLAATLASCRWAVMAMPVSIPLMLLIQPLHGITFALLHLACMRLITDAVPVPFAATAQGLYATCGPGLASVLVTAVSGILFARWGAGAYWGMSGLSALAILPTLRLRHLLIAGENGSPSRDK